MKVDIWRRSRTCRARCSCSDWSGQQCDRLAAVIVEFRTADFPVQMCYSHALELSSRLTEAVAKSMSRYDEIPASDFPPRRPSPAASHADNGHPGGPKPLHRPRTSPGLPADGPAKLQDIAPVAEPANGNPG